MEAADMAQGMEEEEVKVLGFWPSPFFMRVIFALKIKDLKYEEAEEIPFNKSKRLVEANPVHKKIPVLIHNGNPISESAIIVQYIDETWPSQDNNFLPTDPLARAYTRFWADFIDNKVFDASPRIFRTSGEQQEKAREDLVGYLEVVEGELKDDHPFFGGDRMDYADLMLAPIVPWLPVLDNLCAGRLHLTNYPRLHKFGDAVKEHPHLKDCLVDSNKLLEFAKGFRKRFGIDE